jgi:hypothetical protein
MMYLVVVDIHIMFDVKDLTKCIFTISKSFHLTQKLAFEHGYRNPSIRLMTKTRACKGGGQKWSSGVTFHVLESVGKCEGMNPIIPNELPLWELEFRWTSKFSEGNCRGQNSLDWKVHYTIGNFLECRCLTWARMTHLAI